MYPRQFKSEEIAALVCMLLSASAARGPIYQTSQHRDLSTNLQQSTNKFRTMDLAEQKRRNRSFQVYLPTPLSPSAPHSPSPSPTPLPPFPLPPSSSSSPSSPSSPPHSPSPSPTPLPLTPLPPSPPPPSSPSPSPLPPPPLSPRQPRYRRIIKKARKILGIDNGTDSKSTHGNVEATNRPTPSQLPIAMAAPPPYPLDSRANRARRPLSPFIGTHPNPLGSNPPGVPYESLRKDSLPSVFNPKPTKPVVDMSYQEAMQTILKLLPTDCWVLGRLRSFEPRPVSVVVYDPVGTVLVVSDSMVLTSESDIQNVVVNIQFIIDGHAKEQAKQGCAPDKLLLKAIEIRTGIREGFPGINGELMGTTDGKGSVTEWVLWDCRLEGEMVQYWQLIRSKLQLGESDQSKGLLPKPILKIRTARREGELAVNLACGGHYFNTGDPWFDGARYVGGDERAMPSLDMATMMKLLRLDKSDLEQINTGFLPQSSRAGDNDAFTDANNTQTEATSTHQLNYNEQQFSSVTEATKALSEVVAPNRAPDNLLGNLRWDVKKFSKSDRYKYDGEEGDKGKKDQDKATKEVEKNRATTKDASSDKDNSTDDMTEKGNGADFTFDSDDDMELLRPVRYSSEEGKWREERSREHEAAVGFDSDDNGVFFPAVHTRAPVEGADQMAGSKNVSPKKSMLAPGRDSPFYQNLIASQHRTTPILKPAVPDFKMGSSPVVKNANVNPTKSAGSERGGTPVATVRSMTPSMGKPTAPHFIPGQGFGDNRTDSPVHDTGASSTFQGISATKNSSTNFVLGHRRTAAVSPEKTANYSANSQNVLAAGAGNLNPIFSHQLNQYRTSSPGRGGRYGMTYQNIASASANDTSSFSFPQIPNASQSRPSSPGFQPASTNFQTPFGGYGTGTYPNPILFPNYTGGTRVRNDLQQPMYSGNQSHQNSQQNQELGANLLAPFTFDPTNFNFNSTDSSHNGN